MKINGTKKMFTGEDASDDEDALMLQMINANDHTPGTETFYRGLEIIRRRVSAKARRKRRRPVVIGFLTAILIAMMLLRGDDHQLKTVALQDAVFHDVAMIFLEKFDTQILATTTLLYDCRFSAYFQAGNGKEALEYFCKAFDLSYRRNSAGSYYLQGECAEGL